MYKTHTILLVEDEVIISMSTGMLLSRNNYKVETAYTGEEAVELFKRGNSIDLVLMDIDLGSGIDGTKTASEILKLKEIPIVFLTSHAEKEMVEKVKGITRYGYVLKNSGEFVLIEAINMAEELFTAHIALADYNKELVSRNSQLEKAEQRIEKSRTDYQMLFNNIKIGLAFHEMIWDKSGFALDYRFIDLNPAFEILTGLKAAAVIGRTVLELMPETERYWIEIYSEVLKTGRKREFKRFSRVLNKYYSVTAFKVDNNIFAVLFEDITSEFNIKNLLQNSERDISVLINNINEAVIIIDEDLIIRRINKTAEEITGLFQGIGLERKVTGLIDFPGLQSNFEQVLIDILKNSKIHNFILPVVMQVNNGVAAHITGKIATSISNNKSLIFTFKRAIEISGPEQDFFRERLYRMERLSGILLTMQKLYSHMNREKNLKRLIETICLEFVENRDYFNSWICLFSNERGVEVACNAGVGIEYSRLVELIEQGRQTNCIRKALEKDQVILVDEPSVDCCDCPLSSSYGKRAALVYRIENNGEIYGLISASIKKEDANYYEEQILFKQIADELACSICHLKEREKNSRLLQVIHSVPNPMSVVSRDYTYLTINATYLEYYACDHDDIVGNKVADFIDNDVFNNEIKPRIDLCLAGKPQVYDCRVSFPGRQDIKWMRMQYLPAYDENGNINSIISHGADITAEKQNEDNSLVVQLPQKDTDTDNYYLREELYRLVSEKREIFDFIQAGSLDGLWYWDLLNQGNEWISPRFWELLGYNPAEKNHSPEEWQNLADPDDLQVALSNFKKHLEDPYHPYDQEVRYMHRNGSTVWVRCRGIAIRDKYGKPIRMLGAHNDITDLKRSMIENERLMKEAHHRIKNNLLLISSLIQIKERDNENCGHLEILKKQIDSIGSIHDLLSNVDNFNRIDTAVYLKQLLLKFESMYNDFGINIFYSIDSIELESKYAVHLSIIINELLTNAVKHGRIDEEKMDINLFLKKETEYILLIIRNTGAPFSLSLEDASKKSTGFMLIQSLVKGMHGEITLNKNNITEFLIKLRV